MRSSYECEDVTILLKDITGMLEPMDAIEREIKIQSGIHYSELLPKEYCPTKDYQKLYEEALSLHAKTTADAVGILAEKIWEVKNGDVVLVSLARAGTPIGILLKRYYQKYYHTSVPHYTISIIRDRGMDKNAINYILDRHKPTALQFVDGWIGKGAIASELKKAVSVYPGVSGELAVLADPARITNLYGTCEDFLIPSACLNAPVSGLFSRTVLNSDVIQKGEFHGAVYYESMKQYDVSYEFIQRVEGCFTQNPLPVRQEENLNPLSGQAECEQLLKEFDIANINYIKPGIGETTRVLLRRIPWKILVRDKKEMAYIGHILRLCKEKNIEVIEYPLVNYRACGIIKELSDL